MSDTASSISELERSELIKKLIETGCLKFGEFTLKSGVKSDHYVNLREITMNPILFKLLVKLLMRFHPIHHTKNSKIALVGVPYGVVPLASAVAYESNLPYYPVRKEAKNYGFKSDEDAFNDNQFVLIEDVMSSGSSISETIEKMEGKNITDIIVVVNRQQGGDEFLKSKYPNIKIHSLLTLSQIMASKMIDQLVCEYLF